MLVNDDFSLRAIVQAHDYSWVPSPQAGIERVMLDRLGGEAARATSIVRYAPKASYPRHPHPGGEEILVLSGTFSEDNCHYPAGWYLRNPPGSAHQPGSKAGATIFVKLWQMSAAECQRVRINTSDAANWHRQGSLEICPLFSSEAEQVVLMRLAPGDLLPFRADRRTELLLLAGQLELTEQVYASGTWMRLPTGDTPPLQAGATGATLYFKSGFSDYVQAAN